MSASVKIVEDKVTGRLNRMLTRLDGMQSYLDRVVYKQYQDAQIQRWETEGASELKRQWKALSPTYLARKKVKYASHPYGGNRIGIATGDLAQSVIGSDRKHHRKLATKTQLIVGTTIKYASYFSEQRPIFKFSKETKKEIFDGIKDYLKGARG